MRTMMLAVLCVLCSGLLGLGKVLAQEGGTSWTAQDVSNGDRMVLGLKETPQEAPASIVVRPARLAGIECPYPEQPFSTESKAFTKNALRMVFKAASVKILASTPLRWRVDFVLPDGNTLCRELIRNGLAWAEPPELLLPEEREHCKEFKTLEDQARQGRLGLWAGQNPVAPWKFIAQLPAGWEASGKAGPKVRPALPASASAGPTETGEGATQDVLTKVQDLMRKKAATLDELVQRRNNTGAAGDYQTKVRQLDGWAESELSKIIKGGSSQEAEIMCKNLIPAPPSNVVIPEPGRFTSAGEDPFVKEKVNDLMRRECDMVQQLVQEYKQGGRLQEFEAKLRKLDQWEDSEVAAIVKEAFLHKQTLVMQELDNIPWHEMRDYPNWDFLPLKRDVFDHGRWIGRIVQDRNGNIVWYDRPDGPAHWVRYNWLKSIGSK